MSAGFDRYFQFMYSYIKILVYMGDIMNSLEDFVRWIAKQNVVQLDDDQIKKFTNWLIRNEKYNEVVEDLIEMMRQVERKDR